MGWASRDWHCWHAGVYWYLAVCRALGLDGGDTFRACIQALTPDVLKGPFNTQGRTAAGLPQEWWVLCILAIHSEVDNVVCGFQAMCMS